MKFIEILSTLPSIEHIGALNLFDAQGNLAATIPNRQGKAGSVKIYHALMAKHGCINAAAALDGLSMFAEHTADAKLHPGSHPNIDRLFDVITTNTTYQVEIEEVI